MATFTGDNGNNIYTGGPDADVIDGKGGNDSLSGNGGDDQISGGAGADTLSGGDGDDRLFSYEVDPNAIGYPYQGVSLDIYTDHDVLTGGAGSDRLFAGYGDDVDGGSGTQFGPGDYLFISFLGAPAGVTADFGLASQVIGGGTITGIESISWVQGSNFADNLNLRDNASYSDYTYAYGMGGNDTITAGYYTWLIDGGDGDDVLDGRPSQYLHEIDGGAGNDIIYLTLNGSPLGFGGDGDDKLHGGGQMYGGKGNDRLELSYSSYANDAHGDDGDDVLIGPAGRDSRLYGGAGADVLTGGDFGDLLASTDLDTNSGGLPYGIDDAGLEHDVLNGGGGDDLVSAGYGDDVDGGDGIDVLRLSLAGATAALSVTTSTFLNGATGNNGGGTIKNVETLARIVLSDFDDTIDAVTQQFSLSIVAGAGNDAIRSHDSSVLVDAGTGDDIFFSGLAGDYFIGGAGVDTIDYSQYTTDIVVLLNVTGNQGTGAGGDFLLDVENIVSGSGDDKLSGSDLANRIEGGNGDDTIAGFDGADTLLGGDGNDSFDGGKGDDTIDGGAGRDEALIAGRRSDYQITAEAGGFRLTDLRAGANAQGSDLITNVEDFRFQDRSLTAATLLSDLGQPQPGFRATMQGGGKLALGGDGNLFGGNGYQDVTIIDGEGAISLDGSFARGGDLVHLPGAAGLYRVALSGSSVYLVKGDLNVLIPLGTEGLVLAFDDGLRELVFAGGAATLGTQVITSVPLLVTAATDGSILPTPSGDAASASRLILAAQSETVSKGNVEVFGTNGHETIALRSGAANLDASFARGGDRLELTASADDFTAKLTGSIVVLTSSTMLVSIPLGTAGMTIDFAGDERTLYYDLDTSTAHLGTSVITSTALILA